MEFIDLPITQFLLGNDKIYNTKLANYAIKTKINNRIKKYFLRDI